MAQKVDNAVHRINYYPVVKDRSLFITWGGGGGGDFWGDHLIFERKKGESVVTENPKRGIAKNFGRIQRGDHSNLLGK